MTIKLSNKWLIACLIITIVILIYLIYQLKTNPDMLHRIGLVNLYGS